MRAIRVKFDVCCTEQLAGLVDAMNVYDYVAATVVNVTEIFVATFSDEDMQLVVDSLEASYEGVCRIEKVK